MTPLLVRQSRVLRYSVPAVLVTSRPRKQNFQPNTSPEYRFYATVIIHNPPGILLFGRRRESYFRDEFAVDSPLQRRVCKLPLVLSSDSHVFEPPDLWQTRIDAAFRDRAP